MDLELSGTVALVTGASRGIGRAIAEGLAAEGARLVIAARGAEALDEVRLALEATVAEILAVPTDVGDDASVEALVKNARERFGQIDILISNASAPKEQTAFAPMPCCPARLSFRAAVGK